MQKLKVDKELHMKCDICGNEEVIKETPYKFLDCIDYGWSEVDFLRSVFLIGRKCDKYHLCPTCTKRFKKLIAGVELDKED